MILSGNIHLCAFLYCFSYYMTISWSVKLFAFRRIRIVIAGRQRQRNSHYSISGFQNRFLKSTWGTVVLKIKGFYFEEPSSAKTKKNVLKVQRKTWGSLAYHLCQNNSWESSVLNPSRTSETSGGAVKMSVPTPYPRQLSQNLSCWSLGIGT